MNPPNPLPDGATAGAGAWNADVMLDALDRLRDTGPEFGGFLANHGPMAADAMIRLGGQDDVAGWVDRYRRRLSPTVQPGPAITSANWTAHLGRIERLGDWIQLFRKGIADQEWPALLAQWWPRLLPGASASATHGLIRTAHAVRVLADSGGDHPLMLDELANGLAYWAARYQELPGDPGLDGDLALGEAVARLPRLDPNVEPAGPGIDGRLQALTEVGALPRALDDWGPSVIDNAAFDHVIAAAAKVLAARSDAPIAYCHAVTAPSAVRMILPHVPAEHVRATLAACWHVVAAIVAAFAAPPLAAETQSPDASVPDPDRLAQMALAHGDEHVIKLTEACLRQYGHTGDATLLVAADRFRDRLPPG